MSSQQVVEKDQQDMPMRPMVQLWNSQYFANNLSAIGRQKVNRPDTTLSRYACMRNQVLIYFNSF